MKKTSTYIIVGTVLIIGIIIVTNKNSTPKVHTYEVAQSVNIKNEADKQIIEIKAKGGYSPTITTAKAGIPTILRIQTNGTYDCSSALQIPNLNYSANLPPTGTTDIVVPAQTAGTTLAASCSMGMYHFSVKFIS